MHEEAPSIGWAVATEARSPAAHPIVLYLPSCLNFSVLPDLHVGAKSVFNHLSLEPNPIPYSMFIYIVILCSLNIPRLLWITAVALIQG